MFDLFVVSMSLVALGPINMPVSVVRLMRAFRPPNPIPRVRAVPNPDPATADPATATHAACRSTLRGPARTPGSAAWRITSWP